MCVLIGYGCDAVCPYLVLETMFQLRKEGIIDRYLKDSDVFGVCVSWICVSYLALSSGSLLTFVECYDRTMRQLWSEGLPR